MKVCINESVVDNGFISFNTGLNYGRFNFEDLIIDNYKIILSIQEFIGSIQQDYKSIREEIKLDDELQNETSEFTTINYGSITELLNNNQALQDIITSYLDKILFRKLFSQSYKASFIINSTDLVEIIGDSIEISGRSYHSQ